MPESIFKRTIAGRRILFFSPAFFGYEETIRKKMIELGAKVDYFDARSITRAFQRALLKITPRIFDKKTEVYYAHILEQIKDKKYDYVFFVKCDMPTERVLDNYKQAFKDAKFCLYLWDSIKNIPNIKRKFRYFDFISSFDQCDCQKYQQLHFRPLYYSDEYKRTKEDKYEYDLCFIGTIHSDRWRILKELKKQAKEQRLRIYYFLYLQSRFIYVFYKLTKLEFGNTSIKEFNFDKISREKVVEIIEKSKVIIDVQHPRQSGLTIRTIEMIGMSKRLITTNADITQYDFYNPHNIQVIDRYHPLLRMDFYSPYEPLKPEVYERYSLEEWIYEVLGIGLNS